MSDVEARLKETLRASLDAINAEPGRAAAAVRRARRGRVVRGVAAGLAGVLVAGAVAMAWEPRADDPPRPASEPPAHATFVLDFRPGGGRLTVDVAKAQVCLDVAWDVVPSGSALEYEPPGSPSTIVAALGRPRLPRAPRCESVDPGEAARVIDEPHLHRVVLSPGYAVRASFLEPVDPSPGNAPDVLEIVCSEDGAVALTPQAQPRRDGVRLRIYNQGGAWRGFEVSSADGRFGGGGLRRDRVFDKTWTIDPGPHGIRCLRNPRADVYDPEDGSFAQFTIVDPYDLWNDPELECVEGNSRREVTTTAPVPDSRDLPDFDALIRDHVPGVQPGDVLERPFYPESGVKLEPRTLIRDGRKIATFYLGIDKVRGGPGHVWSILPRVCPGSGIADR